MKPKIYRDKANRILIENGYFKGFEILMRDYDISDPIKLKVGLYRHILNYKLLETKKEISKLQAAANRMETACRAGMIPNRHFARTQYDTPYRLLQNALRDFDGWAISLLETNISLLATVFNPETAAIRVTSLPSSFAELYLDRLKDLEPYNNIPALFDLSVSVDLT
jgi:hypothetical protein